MTTRFKLVLALRIVLLFTAAIFLSFLPDYLHDFFGDWHCSGRQYVSPEYVGCDYNTGNFNTHPPTLHWGYRHWLWISMGLCLAIIQIVDIVNYITKNQDK